MCKAAKALKDRGAASVMAVGTHPVLSGGAYDKKINESVLDEVVLSNSIPLQQTSPKIKIYLSHRFLLRSCVGFITMKV